MSFLLLSEELVQEEKLGPRGYTYGHTGMENRDDNDDGGEGKGRTSNHGSHQPMAATAHTATTRAVAKEVSLYTWYRLSSSEKGKRSTL